MAALSARNKQWIVREPAPGDVLAALRAYHPLVATLLYHRGQRTPAEVSTFLQAEYSSGRHDPFLMKGMDAAAKRIAQAIVEQEPIVVYGDFDADGVTAVALLVQAIGAMGGAITPYIPNRHREGYGLNTEAANQLAASGARVLVTVDCGISNVAEVAVAQAAGLDVIVTDHHTPPDILPAAYTVVNPKQPGCEYPFKQLVGVGIAFKLVEALTRLGVHLPLRGRDLLDMVALGTVTDMGPLLDENRTLVKAGVDAINTTQRAGLRALIASAGLAPGRVEAEDISFMLGPRLNAAGRLDDAVLAYQLLLADDDVSAQQFASELSQANRQRQDLTKQTQAAAIARLTELGKAERAIIVLDDAAFPAGVVGLVAARMADDLGRPMLLLERGPQVSRGSARSIPGFNILDALNSCSDLFVRYGGHSAAAGFTIENERLPELETRLLAYAEQHLGEEQLAPRLDIEAEAELSTINWDLLATLDQLKPFGAANPRPLLMSHRVHVAGAWAKGADGQHLKLRLDDGRGVPAYDAIGFRLGHLASYFPRHPWIDIAYTVDVNEWNGNRKLQLTIKDLRRAA